MWRGPSEGVGSGGLQPRGWDAWGWGQNRGRGQRAVSWVSPLPCSNVGRAGLPWWGSQTATHPRPPELSAGNHSCLGAGWRRQPQPSWCGRVSRGQAPQSSWESRRGGQCWRHRARTTPEARWQDASQGREQATESTTSPPGLPRRGFEARRGSHALKGQAEVSTTSLANAAQLQRNKVQLAHRRCHQCHHEGPWSPLDSLETPAPTTPPKIPVTEPISCAESAPAFWGVISRAGTSRTLNSQESAAIMLLSTQFSPVAQLCPILFDPVDCSTLGLPVHHQLRVYSNSCPLSRDAIQPSHPLSSPSPPTFNLSQYQGFFKWVLRIRWPKYWSFSFSISPSDEYSGQISFRMDWLGLLSVQGTLKNLLQHYSLKHQSSGFTSFMVHLSHPYMSTGKTIALIDGPLLEKQCLCFLIHCLGLS